jgi:hypothetical protein
MSSIKYNFNTVNKIWVYFVIEFFMGLEILTSPSNDGRRRHSNMLAVLGAQ